MSKQMNTPATTLADIKTLVKKLHLSRMMERLEELYADPSVQDLTPMEIIHDVLTAEVDRRTENALKRRLKDAHIRHQDACLGNIDFETPRGLDKAKIMQLGNCDWIRNHQNCIITGKTGCGKTFLAGAIANAACRQRPTVRFVRVPRFLKEFSAQHQVDRGFERELRALRRIDLLILDDWGIGQIDAINRSDFTRNNRGSMRSRQHSCDQRASGKGLGGIHQGSDLLRFDPRSSCAQRVSHQHERRIHARSDTIRCCSR